MKNVAASTVILALSLLCSGHALVLKGNKSADNHLVSCSLDASQTESFFDQLHTLFIFGDSISDTGFDPSGDAPSPANPLGNPDFPGRTTAWGPNWVGTLTKEYSKTLVAWNFAKYGSVVYNAFPNSERPDFTGQLSHFMTCCTGKKRKVKWTSEDALFLTMFGQNDLTELIDHLSTNLKTVQDIQRFEKAAKDMTLDIMGRYIGKWATLYENGARKFVAITPTKYMAVPDTLKRVADFNAAQGKLIADTFLEALTNVAADFNSKLAALSHRFKSMNPESTVFYYDATLLMDQVITKTRVSSYEDMVHFCQYYKGLPINSTTPVYPDPPSPAAYKACKKLKVNVHLWLDAWHPTWLFHSILAEEIHTMLAKFPV
ncbi:hypothetical protein BCR37DRAFT_47641 [Protomyces lactucae-debilis]|uniref:GDSL lipase/esterase n=1 Tax=Protomyces lactucae-debilis TaxID=2754530 RepID=A0A1Y2FCC2_PROLT|nr:uncharacterized protein BCR37DRAFT_47641 [Protomyces lactucae-debilis]ORY81562.1 hypothetical protein BCR37DRAFT_47641 [Protomyces lactucae-debilis]